MQDYKEITVEVDTDLDSLKEILNNQNFKVIEEYDLNDIYMIDKKCNLKQKPLEILKQCILIRSIITDKITNMLTYKWKQYNEKEEILKQADVNCVIESINDAEHFFNAIGYIRLFEIRDHLIIYSNGFIEFAVQVVNDKHVYIELEERINCYKSVEEMKKEINKYNIPIKDNNYFAKKALVELREILNK